MVITIALLHKSKVYLSGSLSDIKNRFRKNEYRVVLEMPESEFNARAKTLNQTFSPTKLEYARSFAEMEFHLPESSSVKATLNELLKLGNLVEFRELLPGMDRIFVETVTESPEE